jgi:hypothetical protein
MFPRQWTFKSRSSGVVIPCSVAVGYQRFGGLCCFHLHFTLNMETWSSSKTLVSYLNTTRHHFPRRPRLNGCRLLPLHRVASYERTYDDVSVCISVVSYVYGTWYVTLREEYRLKVLAYFHTTKKYGIIFGGNSSNNKMIFTTVYP